MVVLSSMKKIRSKNEPTRVLTRLYKDFSDAQGQVTCKNEEDPIKMKDIECYQHFSHYKSKGIILDAKGHLTSQSLVKSGRNSNSSKILWLSSLTASMKKIRAKMKALEC